jgi:hypothetical protein
MLVPETLRPSSTGPRQADLQITTSVHLQGMARPTLHSLLTLASLIATPTKLLLNGSLTPCDGAALVNLDAIKAATLR